MLNKTSNITDFNEINSYIYKEYIFYTNKILEIGFYLQLVTIPVGIIGNLAAIYIFTRPRLNRNTNTGFLYTILCVLNLIKILYQAIFKRWDNYLDYNIKIPLTFEMLFENLIVQMLSWIEVLIGFDRFIAVFSPIKGVRIMRKKWVLYSIVLGLFLFILSVNSPYFIRYSISTTIYLNNFTYFNYRVMIYDLLKYSILKIIIEVHLPYLIIVVLDVLVFFRFSRSKTNIVNSNITHNRTSKFTINTILIDLIFLIINFPYTIINIFLLINLFRTLSLYSSNLFIFISLLFQRLPFIYSSFIFVIFIIFNRNFRSEFLSIGLVLKFKNFILSINNR